MFPYRGYHGCLSRCRLRVYEESGTPPVVIVTERDDNPGTSITNRAEYLATAVWQMLERPEAGMVWIEHYEDRALIGGKPLFKEKFDSVTFTSTSRGFSDPRWKPISKAEVEILIGQPLEGSPR